jgi:anti-sigma factor RsiW
MFKRFKRSEHKRVEELLSAYIDGELPIEEATLVEKHLRDCSACTQNLETLRQTVSLMQQLPAVSPPRSFAISHLVVPERPRAWGYVYLRGATALAALLLTVLLAGDLGFQYLWAPRIAAPAPAPVEATVETSEAEIEVAVETPTAREAFDLMEAQKMEETPAPLAEATLPAERLGAALPSPEPTPTSELVAAAESPLPLPIAEGRAYATLRAERAFVSLSTLRLLEGAVFGAFLILAGATALVRWRREQHRSP